MSGRGLPVFDVTRYGAVGDGATASNTAIQAALTAAAAYTALSTRNFADVEVPRGVYVANAVLNIAGDRIRLRGNGATFTKSANGTEDQMIYVTGTDCEIHGLTLDGQYPTYASSNDGHGINLASTRCTLEKVNIKNVKGRGIVDGTAGWGNKLVRCRTENTGGSGIRNGGDWLTIKDCEIVDWNAANAGSNAILASSSQYDADSLVIDGLRCVATTATANEGILVDAGDNAATGQSIHVLNLGNGGAATNNRGKAQWAIDAGHGFKVGDGFLVDNTGVAAYDGSAGVGMAHKIIAVTGEVFVRSTGSTTFTLHTSAAGAVANTGQVTLSTTGAGTFYVKCYGVPQCTVTDAATAVNTGTGVITTDAAHGFRNGQSVRLTINAAGVDVLPGGLADAATITVNTAYSSAGSGGVYTRPKRYTNVSVKNYRHTVYPGSGSATAMNKFSNIASLDISEITIDHPGQAVDHTSLQLAGNLRKASLRNCRIGGRVTNNILAWLNELVVDSCEIGIGDVVPDYAINQIACTRLTLRNSTLKFQYAAISLPDRVEDFRDADCESLDIRNNTLECATSGRGRVLTIDNVEHLRHSGILRYYGNTRRNPLYAGLALASDGSDIATGTNIITATAHCLETGDAVTLDNTGGALPTVSGTALDEVTSYYVRRLGANTLTLHYTSPAEAAGNSSVVDFTGTGSGTTSILSDKIGCQLSGAGPRDISLLQRNGNGRDFMDVAAPTSTSFEYKIGDIVWNMNQASGSPTGWVCTKTGVAGTTAATFAAMANLP